MKDKIIPFFKRNKGSLDYYLVASVLLLAVIGVVYSYSSQLQIYEETVNVYNRYIKQLIYLVISIFLMIIVRLINYQKVAKYYWIIYIISIIALLYTLINGNVVNNSKRWISFGFFNIQPSEFLKIIMVVFIAAYIEKNRNTIYQLKNILVFFFLIILPVFLIFLQPDLGTALLFLPITFIIFWFNRLPRHYAFFILITFFITLSIPILTTYSKNLDTETIFFKIIVSKEYLLFLIIFFIYISILITILNLRLKSNIIFYISFYTFTVFIGLSCAFIVDNYILKDYQRQRLLVYLNPFEDRWNKGYNVVQSQITIGSGGLWGKGLFSGSYSQLGFLPSRTTDFIFSVIAEELGFIGASAVIFLFFFMLFRIWKIIGLVRDSLGKNIIIGLFCLYAIQIIINIGMTVSLLPVTGIPLPFISAGGSTLIANFIGIGLILAIQSKRWVNSSI